MKYKIIFSDIDGTIINSQHFISKKTKDTLMNMNLPVVLVSARMPEGIRSIQRQLDNQDPIICYSGALVLNGQEVIYDEGIEIETAKELYSDVVKENVSISVYCYEHWYGHCYDQWIRQEEEITSLKAIIARFDNEKKVHKILCMAEPEKINDLQQKIKNKYPFLSVYKSKATYLEIMSGNISKLKAIEVLLKYYHLTLNDSVSFGDNYNDLDMLENTGLSFVMANAPTEIKNKIGRVTLSNDEDGVAYAIENLL